MGKERGREATRKNLEERRLLCATVDDVADNARNASALWVWHALTGCWYYFDPEEGPCPNEMELRRVA